MPRAMARPRPAPPSDRRLVQPHQPVEDPFPVRDGHAGAAVGDAHPPVRDVHGDRRAGRGVPARVVEQVAQHLREPGRIAGTTLADPSTVTGRPGSSSCARSASAWASSSRSTGSRRRSMPASMRASASRSSTSRPARRLSRSSRNCSRSRSSRGRPGSSAASITACIPASGVRSSCAASATKRRVRASDATGGGLRPLQGVEHVVERGGGAPQLGVGALGGEPAAAVATGDGPGHRGHRVERGQRQLGRPQRDGRGHDQPAHAQQQQDAAQALLRVGDRAGITDQHQPRAVAQRLLRDLVDGAAAPGRSRSGWPLPPRTHDDRADPRPGHLPHDVLAGAALRGQLLGQHRPRRQRGAQVGVALRHEDDVGEQGDPRQHDRQHDDRRRGDARPQRSHGVSARST